MTHILACIDASSYANRVCDLAAWAAMRTGLPIELLHIVQRRDVAAARGDLSGAIGLGVKSDLMEEIVRLEAEDARLQIERGRALLAAGEEYLAQQGAADIRPLHRHGGIVETVIEREEDAALVVMGKRGASHEFASDHIGSKIERVVRASAKPILVASRTSEKPRSIVLAYDASPAAERACKELADSRLLSGMPVHLVMADTDDSAHRQALAAAAARLEEGRAVETSLERGKPEDVIARIVADTPGALLMMGAYGHSPLRRLIVGSTTTAMIRTIRVPVLLIR